MDKRHFKQVEAKNLIFFVLVMITFKHRSNSKRINIRTSKKLDERMSGWLQKVFGIKSQIIGFKSAESKHTSR